MKKIFNKFLVRTQSFRNWGVRHVRLLYILSLFGFGFDLMTFLMFEEGGAWCVIIGFILLLSLYQTITIYRRQQQKWCQNGLLWLYIIWLGYCLFRLATTIIIPLSLIGAPYMGFITGLILITFLILFIYYTLQVIGTILMLLIHYTVLDEKQKEVPEETYLNSTLNQKSTINS